MKSIEVTEPTEQYHAAWRPSRGIWLIAVTWVLLLAAVFRLIALQEVPPGLAQDEVLDADIAMFIRQGEHALFFRHGYGHEPLFHYLAVPFQVLLGDNTLAIRLLPAFLGMLLVAGVIRWARRDFGATASLVAGIGIGVSWWPIIFSRIGIRPILEPVLLVGMIWFWPLRAKVLSHRAVVQAGLAGLFLGLAVYSYTAARALLLLPVAYLGFLGFRYLFERMHRGPDTVAISWTSRSIRSQAVCALIVLLVSLIICLPLAMTLRANPELQQRIEQLEGPLNALRSGDAGPVIKSTLATFGVFAFTGDPRWTYSLPNKPLFDPLSALLFLLGLIVTVKHWRWPVFAILPIWLVLALMPSALSPDAPSTVRMVGAIPVVYILPGLGFTAVLLRYRQITARMRDVEGRKLIVVGIGILVIILSINLYRTARDGFIKWPNDLETHLRYQTVVRDMVRYLQVNDVVDRPVVLAEAFFEPIDDATLQRNAGQHIDARWIQTGSELGGAIVWPVSDPDSQPVLLLVPEYAPLPVELSMAGGIGIEPNYRSPGKPSFAVYELQPMPELTSNMLEPEIFLSADKPLLSLLGYEWLADPSKSIEDSSSLRIATSWKIHNDLPNDIAIFIHLVDEEGEIVAQSDDFDAAASLLTPGDQVIQRHLLSLNGPIPPGTYKIMAGLYQRDTGTRFNLSDGVSDALELFQCVLSHDGEDENRFTCKLSDNN